ncbi:MAG TPA: cobalt ECF transporter T component CbiQ [Anaerolineaceae bacterium]|jgi:cobalt ECF transporter T component CbiQ
MNANPAPRARRTFIERTLSDIDQTVGQSFFAEEAARLPGLLQSLDPRAKLVCTLLILLLVSLAHNLAVIGAVYLLALVAAAFSSVRLGFFIRRVWLLLPFFTGVIALPALFLTPGPALWHLPGGVAVTRSGALVALFLVLRVGTSVSWAALLVLTTPWNVLLRALAVLRVPDVMVLILGMTYRYIYLLLRVTGEMLLSRKSRIVGRLEGKAERQLLAASLGTLLSRSLDLSGEVYLAMQSRGFRSAPRTFNQPRLRVRDWAALALVSAVCLLALWIGR